jgi:hypothetical protein
MIARRQRLGTRSAALVIAFALASIAFAAARPAQAVAASIPLATSPYGSPNVTTSDEGTTIDVNPGPAGVYYRATLDPTRTYRLTVMGQDVNGSFVLRLNEDGNLRYVGAPNGPAVYRITGTTSFEALIYRDSPGAYLVRSIVLEDCANLCETDTDLKAEIASALPGLQQALADRDYYQAGQQILGWVAPRIVWASGQPAPIATAGLSAAEIYSDYFQTGYGGVYCGGSADFLHKVLDLFSIPNFELDFGTTTDGLTHATIVIPVSEPSGQVDYRILDPTFNMVLTLINSGEPASIPVALELWRMGLTSRVVFDSSDLSQREVLTDPNGNGEYVETACGSETAPSPGCGFDEAMSLWQPYLLRDGFQSGSAAYLQLLGTTQLFTPDAFGVPQDLQDMIGTFKAAVANGDDSVHIATPPLPPVMSSPPTVTGSAQVGSTLDANPGDWSAVNPVTSEAYRWFACQPGTSTCAPIPAATTSSYTTQPADAGLEIYVSVTAHNQDGDSLPAASVRTAPIEPAARTVTHSTESAPTEPSAAAPAVGPPPVVTPPAVCPRLSGPRSSLTVKLGRSRRAVVVTVHDRGPRGVALIVALRLRVPGRSRHVTVLELIKPPRWLLHAGGTKRLKIPGRAAHAGLVVRVAWVGSSSPFGTCTGVVRRSA